MFSKKKEIARMEAVLDAHTPSIEEYEKIPSKTPSLSKERKHLGFLALGSLGSALAISGVTVAIVLSLTSRSPFHPNYEIAAPEERTKTSLGSFTADYSQYLYSDENSVSEKTQAIYLAYCSKIVPTVFSHDNEKSKSFSLVDSFVNLCLTAYTSGSAFSQIVLSLLGAKDKSELKTAAQEIILALGTPIYESDSTRGGFTLQSIWIDGNTPLKADISAIKDDLEQSFYCSLFHHAPEAKEINRYYDANTPEEFGESPQVSLPENSSIDSALVSSYYILDKYSPNTALSYRDQYLSRSHYLDYTLPNGTSKKVDYIQTMVRDQYLYVGSGFVGADCPVSSLSFTYFLPNEKTGDLSPVMSAAAQGNYQSTLPEQDSTRPNQTIYYDVDVSAPYFNISSSLDLLADFAKAGVDLTSANDLFGELIDEQQNPAGHVAVGMKQSSFIHYDFNGLYAGSKTIFAGAGAAGPGNHIYPLTLDHPYVFRVNSQKIGIKNTTKSTRLPLIYGEVIDPNYAKA
jgi:hypothetical protein